MKNSILGVVCASLVAGALGAIVASVYVIPPPPAAPPVVREGPSAGELERELQALQASNADLSRRIQRLEDRPRVAESETRTAIPPAPSAEEATAPPELEKLVAALRDPHAPLPENLKTTVGEALKAIRAEEERERRDHAAELASQQIEERLQVLTQQLGLAPRQTNDLRDLFTMQAAKRDELWRAVRDSGDLTTTRDAMRELRTTVDTRLAEILTPVQLDEYNKLDAQDRRLDYGLGRFSRSSRGEGR